MEAAVRCGHGKLAAAGGVAANSFLSASLELGALEHGLSLYITPPSLCGDNAAMIACQGYFEYMDGRRADASLNAYATMGLDEANEYGVTGTADCGLRKRAERQ